MVSAISALSSGSNELPASVSTWAKPLMMLSPKTLFGCLTIASFFDPSLDTEGKVDKMRRVKTLVFVHSKTLRESFDTFETVEKHALVGFKDKIDRLNNDD